MNKKITLSIIYSLFLLWAFESTLLAFNVNWLEISLLCLSGFAPIYLGLHFIPNRSKLLVLTVLRGIVMGSVPHLLFWSVALSSDAMIFNDFLENRFAVLGLSLITFVFLAPLVLLPALTISFFNDYSQIVFSKLEIIKLFKSKN